MILFGNGNLKLDHLGKLLYGVDTSKPKEKYKEKILAEGEAALNYEPTLLRASLYMNYFRTGNRSDFENVYHERRAMLSRLILAALYGDADRYVGKMVDIIWAICEETSWVIPPHSVAKGYILGGKPLPDQFGDDILEVDLFSASTSAVLSMAYFFFSDKLAAATDGVITERMEYEIRRRIIKPFLQNEMRWEYSFINNWLPWIISNVLTCAAVFVKDLRPTMQTIVSRATFYLDRFAGTYGEDCGCNEGASYWNAAGASLFDACEVIYDITDGAVNGLCTEFMKKAAHFIADMCISPREKLFVNFADCGPYVKSISGDMLSRMGARLGDGVLTTLGEEFSRDVEVELNARQVAFFAYRYVKNLFYTERGESAPMPFGSVVYGDLQVALLRDGDLTCVLKGGHNRESHNHNDVGNFLLYRKSDPIIIDAGNLEYTRDTFNENRYKIWTNQSSYHNLPDIDGVMQQAGREFAADRFECLGDSASVSYGGAYPIPVEATRTVRLCGGTLTVYDRVNSEKAATFRFMTVKKPVISGDTAVIGGVRASFSENGGISVDEVDVSSSNIMKNSWKSDKLYRISVRANALTTTFTEV